MKKMWTIADMRPVKRASAYGPMSDLVERAVPMPEEYGWHRTRQEAMSAAIDMWLPDVATKDWNLKKRHWPYVKNCLGKRAVKLEQGESK